MPNSKYRCQRPNARNKVQATAITQAGGLVFQNCIHPKLNLGMVAMADAARQTQKHRCRKTNARHIIQEIAIFACRV